MKRFIFLLSLILTNNMDPPPDQCSPNDRLEPFSRCQIIVRNTLIFFKTIKLSVDYYVKKAKIHKHKNEKTIQFTCRIDDNNRGICPRNR